MNLLGHVAIARGEREEPGFALGAMLPDLSSMSGLRLLRARHPTLADGVHLHYRTDHAFHAAPSFAALLAEGARELRARGVHAGRARAASHVGVELLLDGTLVEDARCADHYLEALRGAPGLLPSIEFRGGRGAGTLSELVRRLLAHGVPFDCGDPARVAERVRRALSVRPRLSLTPAEHEPLEAWLRRAAPRVRNLAPALLAETRDRLAPL